ncbi:hypothetical protein EMQ25_03275 [Arsenicitalea aurantiaca]|uniref:SH3b domain-containing protein n=1 Tax=Arsenicitalea aurantiaca TaxID=1783274 RepID=A0A433XLN3_9HYPH|nr:SH3 domain-containing protein [Arsenicitalea aurantiaca]RUT34989.1 hypothetical protein EMQ25_03275 [Arsenicitalea aurantiaca]
MPLLRALVLAALASLLALPAAAQHTTGTAAWTNSAQIVYEGPGLRYRIMGEVPGEVRVRVERCSNAWCRIRADHARGWVALDALSFGQAPGGPFSGPKLNLKAGGPGEVCFHSGRNFTGETHCARSGTVVPDLLLYNRDNRVASISIAGNVSVMVCRDRNFVNYCQRINDSTPRLTGYLENNVSSYRVY